MTKMKFSNREIKEAIVTIYGMLTEGLDDKDVMDEMGLSDEDYKDLRLAMMDTKIEELKSRPNEYFYVEYLINQVGNVRDLTTAIGELFSNGKFSSVASAVKARADIYDRIVEKGQEFKIIKKTPERKEIVAGVVVSELSNKELKKMIVGELGELNSLREKYGDGNIIDLESKDDLHYGPSLPVNIENEKVKVLDKKEIPKNNKAKTRKVKTGRKRKLPTSPRSEQDD